MTEPQQQRYRVIERLASGGMAEVFLAESAGIEGFKKQVAIKRVLPHLSEKKRFIAMFLDEARLSAHLTHSNVAQVFDIGVGDNAYFIVMEYVDGADLKGVIEFIRKGGRNFQVEGACFIAARICEGLTYAHELRGSDGNHLKIVHRDMSPPNVLITKYGEVKIVDFGLAKATSQLEKSEAGIIKGKFSYLSPEAAQGGDVDHRTDIYAVGIILWEMLAGRRLFLGDTDFATVKLVQESKIPPLSSINKDVPKALDNILARALTRDPNARYGSARDLGRDLTSFLYQFGRPVSAFDVAELVRGAMTLRKKQAPDKASIIDKLIEEALLEFTSLTDDAKEAAEKAAPKKDDPLKIGGFEDIGKWADDIAGGGVSKAPAPPTDLSSLEDGGLSGLEDDPVPEVAPEPEVAPTPEPAAAAPAKRRLSVPPSAQVAAFVAKKQDSEAPLAPPAKAGGGGAMKAILLVAVLGALAAGAWFANIIPH